MILIYHKDCKINKGHQPKIQMDVKTIKEAIEVIQKAEVKLGYLDWDNIKGSHYIVYKDCAVDYKEYNKKLKTKLIRYSDL